MRVLAGCLIAVAVLCASQRAAAQTTAAWIWVGGSNTINQPGNCGTLGMQPSGNVPQGAAEYVNTVDDSQIL